MTPSDLRELARYWDWKETTFTSTGPGALTLVAANQQRWAIGFSAGGGTAEITVTTTAGTTNGNGWIILLASNLAPTPVQFNYWDWGSIVQQAWNANCQGTNSRITVFEAILQDR